MHHCSHRRRSRPGFLVLIALVTLASCTGPDATDTVSTHPGPVASIQPVTTAPTTTTTVPTTTTEATPTVATTTTTTTPPTTSDVWAGPPRWDHLEPLPPSTDAAALTGRPLDGVDPVTAVLAVKVDNHPQAGPQTALEEADVIFEENVEGVTRFIALFHSRQPDTIGPIRSARTSDLPILAAMNRPILAWSGGNGYVTEAVANAAEAGILVDEGHPVLGSCYRRGGGRRAPHNLFADPACLRAAATTAGPARPLWSFGDLPADMGAEATPSFSVAMEGVTVRWSWDAASGRYLRSQRGRAHVTTSGARVAADNVVVLDVEYRPSPADARSPDARTVGSGPVVVHRGGRSLAGTWERAQLTDPYRFLDPSGRVIPLAPGTTFVELAAR